MSDDQDWRLRVELADAAGFHGRLRDAHHFERELEPLVADEVVLSYNDDTLFAYANTEAAIREVRRAVEHQLSSDGASGAIVVSHWDDDLGDLGDWHQVDPPEAPSTAALEEDEHHEHELAQEREERVVTRTYVVNAGRLVNEYFERSAQVEAKEAGVELSFTEHPHLLTTQIAFTLTGPAGKVEDVIGDMKARAGALTRLESFAI
jgi:chorismate-pyruvate lyase